MQYLKWKITKLRNTTEYIKITGFQTWADGTSQMSFSAVSCTINGAEPYYFSDSEHIENLIDGTSSVFCCRFDTECTIILTLTDATDIFYAYNYVTGNNLPEWDPVSWELYKSDDGTTWELVDAQTDADITMSRNSSTQLLILDGWYVDSDGHLTNDRLKPVKQMGAFANCVSLRNVSIPPSVKSIGRYAFYNTSLTSVTIASDCTYYSTSFPDGCTISFY